MAFRSPIPNSSGDPRWLRRNNGVFMVYEQMLQRAAPDSDKGAAFFLRAASVSPSDRNLVNAYVDGGFLFTGFSEKRPNDRFGVAATFARISDRARQLDRDVQIFTGTAYPIRDFEAILEITYQAEIMPNFLVQPVFEYIAHPAGGAVDPNDPDANAPDQGRRHDRRPHHDHVLALAKAAAVAGFGGREIASTINAAMMHSAPATKNAGR